MRVCVCRGGCMHACMCVCMCVCMRMHTCVCVRVCLSTNNLCRSTGCGNEILSVVIRSVGINNKKMVRCCDHCVCGL